MTKHTKRAATPPSMNEKRVAFADAALTTFIDQTGTDREDSLVDLLCDLIHGRSKTTLISRVRSCGPLATTRWN
jgi:hypothetical protein